MEKKEFNAAYVRAVFAALDRLRREATGAEAAYLKRLEGLCDSASQSAQSSVAAASSVSIWSRLKTSFGRKTRPFILWARALRLLPAFIVQLRGLSRAGAHADFSNCLIIAIASNRISLSSRVSSVRPYLAALMQPLQAGGDKRILAKLGAAEHLLLFDTLPVSDLWKHRRQCRTEGVLIVDGAFLYFLVACAFLSGFFQCCRSLLEVVRAVRALPGGSQPGELPRTVFYALIARAFARVLSRFNSIEALFLSSNSMLVELLRAYLIREPKCGEMYELMHGIGSIPVGRYFSSMLAAGTGYGAYRKHYFIPQIPGLPLAEIFDPEVQYLNSLATNGFLNRYLLEQVGPGDVQHFIDVQCRALGVGNGYEPLILTVFGNIPNTGGLTESSSFRMECLLIALLAEFKHLLQQECLLVYVPHPAYPLAPFKEYFARENLVRVQPSSIPCWMASDLCVSLLSSSMFEAAYFGAPAFTPLIAEDRFYSPGYLKLLSHPQSGSFAALAEALKHFLKRYDGGHRRPTADKMHSRLEWMRGGGKAGVAMGGPVQSKSGPGAYTGFY